MLKVDNSHDLVCSDLARDFVFLLVREDRMAGTFFLFFLPLLLSSSRR